MIPSAPLPPAALLSPAALPAQPAPSPAPTAVQIDAFQAGAQQSGGSGIGQALTNAVDGFSARAQQMQASMRDLAAREMTPGSASLSLARPPVQEPAPVGAMPAVQGGAKPASPMGLMMDSFNFAIEASLVSRAATQFTGAVGTLMKGQ